MSLQLAFYAKQVVKIDQPLYNYTATNMSSITKNVNQECVDNVIRVVEIIADFFTETSYAHHLPMMKLQNKIYLLTISPVESRPLVATLYREIDYRKFDIPARHKFVLWLCQKGMLRTLNIYMSGKQKLKELKKSMRGRTRK